MSSSQTIQIDFGPTLGALLIGVVLGAVFLGITCLQTAFYYCTYPNDTASLKVLVGVLCVLDVLSLTLWTHAGYTYLVTNSGNPTLADSLVWSTAAEPAVTGIIALSVHLYLSWRIQILDRRWRVLSIVIALASFASFSLVIMVVTLEIAGIKHGLSVPTIVKQIQWYTFAGDVSASVIILTISGSISYLLYRGRNGFSNTDRILRKVTLYIVASGAITSTVRVLNLVLSRAYPNTTYFLIPYISLSKAYTNALLATLNSRPGRRYPLSNPAQALELHNGTLESVKLPVSAAKARYEFSMGA